MSHLPLALVTSLALALICGAPRSARAQDTAALTAMDYIEIQQLVNKLNFALDYCTNAGQDFADLFAEDGEYIIDYGNDDVRVVNTREDLIRLAGGPDCESRKTPPSPNVLHLAESLVIEPSGSGARGKSYAIYPSNKGKYFAEDVAGQHGFYHDEYVRTPDGCGCGDTRFLRSRAERCQAAATRSGAGACIASARPVFADGARSKRAHERPAAA